MASAFEILQEKLGEVGRRTAVPPALFDRLAQSERVVAVMLPLRRDDGSLEFFRGWRVQYSSLLGP